MKQDRHFLNFWQLAFGFVWVAAVTPVAASESGEKRAALPPLPRSIFELPTTPRDGRDPFFPNSPRLFASMAVPQAKSKDLSSLVVRGKSGTPDHPLVIINDITFAQGDERDVITPGGRIQIHCLQIIGDLVVIEANGERHQLRSSLKP
jgi:hypothetical protein